MRKLLVIAAAALVVPGLALAGGNPGTSHGKAAPKVMYVLKGTLTAYTAANGATAGSVSIQVKAANYHGASLKTQTLTFPVVAATKIAGKFTAGDNGVVKVRAPKNVTPASGLAAALQALPAFQVIDQGAGTTSG